MLKEKQVYVYLTIVRYPLPYCFFALLAMALHRIGLFLNKKHSFSKLMGSGHGGGFSKKPDWQQWAIMVVQEEPIAEIVTYPQLLKSIYGSFIAGWYRLFKCETCTFILQPLSGHGQWDGRAAFGNLATQAANSSPVAVLTRATIRFKKLGRFWQHVKGMNALLSAAGGLLYSQSLGELPFIKQATFSIWQNSEAMTDFAYKMREHAEVIQKTRKEDWYAEELFARFSLLAIHGTIRGKHPSYSK